MPAPEVRKTVTVVFADITGSTALGERLDAESFRRVIGRYFDLARSCLERHGGSVQKFIGDAVVAVFGVPVMHEDDALRALRAAAELLDSLDALNDQLERDYGVSLQLRMGVNTGEVITDADQLATGVTMNVAARLQQAAPPGEILICDRTRRLARGAIEVQPVDALSLRGKAQPLPAHRLVRVLQGAPAFERRLDTPLVGRQDEFAEIRAAFDGAVSERCCRLVTAIGPPGIGKSRLAHELAEMLAPEATVLSGRCLPYGEGITYWPLVEIFRDAEAEQELEVALAAGGPEEIFWSVRKALEPRARARPLTLIVEDIHWAEPTLLDLLEHLSEWTRDAPLLLLCLARPELIDGRPAWCGDRIMLEPLSGEECDELISGLIDSELEHEIRDRIRDVAEGNPLFVEQMLAGLTEGGHPEDVPATMHALLAARLDALPEDEREVLERASVVGLEFEWEALAELAPEWRRPSGAQLAALVRKAFIRPQETLEDTFRFRHILIRDAAYERIPKELRAELHERFAAWLDARDEQSEEIVGYHLEQAYRCLVDLGPRDERAQALAEQAAGRLAASGLRACTRGDAPAGARLLQRAIALYLPEDPQRLRLLPTLGRALVELGQTHPANSVLSEAVERGRATGQDAVAMDAAVALSTLRLHTAPQEKVGQDVVWRELEAAIPFYEATGDEAGLARVLGVAGSLRFWRGEAAAAIKDLERAARHARNAGDWAQEVESLQYVLMAMLRGPTPVSDALARIEELGAIAEQNRLLRPHLLRVRAHLEAMQGSFATARDLIVQAKELATELGLELTLTRIASQAGSVELLAGDAVAAEHELRPAYEALRRTENWGYLSSLVPILVDALLVQGQDDEALRLTESRELLRTPEDVDGQVGWRCVRARLLARRGDAAEAERLARDAVAMAARTNYLELRAQAAAGLGEVLGLAARPAESLAPLEEAIRLYEKKGHTTGAARLRRVLAETRREH